MSRDGITFTRVLPHRPIVARGARHEWDSAFLVTSSDWVVHDDRIWIYYSGASEDWVNWPGTAPEGLPTSSGQAHTCKMGLATLRLDGLAYVETWDGEMPGQVTARPLTVPATGPQLRLWINADGLLPRRSWIEVETVDAESCAPLAGKDGSGRTALASGGVHLPVDHQFEPGQRCRLRFHLYGQARLYAFGFEAADQHFFGILQNPMFMNQTMLGYASTATRSASDLEPLVVTWRNRKRQSSANRPRCLD